MAPMNAAEKSLTRGYGLLASRLCEVLTRVQRSSEPPRTNELELLTSGELLLDQFISGSRLVEGKLEKGELAPRLDNMRAFRHAISTLKELQKVGEDETISQALGDIRESLHSVRKAKSSGQVIKNDVENALNFFVTLTALLTDDLVRQRLEGAAPRRPTPPTVSE